MREQKTPHAAGGLQAATEESEYGKGLAICLVKFAGHFGNEYVHRIMSVHYWHDKANSVLKGDEDINYRQDVELFQRVELSVRGSYQEALSSLITLWANGATDHLFDIKVPKKWRHTTLARMVAELQDLGLEMGHGFNGKIYTFDDFNKLFTLTMEVAHKLDVVLWKELGENPDVDKGTWA